MRIAHILVISLVCVAAYGCTGIERKPIVEQPKTVPDYIYSPVTGVRG
jgi:hypothetical protein